MKALFFIFVLLNGVVVFANSDPNCGVVGSVKDRIQDCAKLPNSEKNPTGSVVWNLISRMHDDKTGRSYQVWQDSNTKLLWGDMLDSSYHHINAAEWDWDRGVVTKEIACTSNEGSRANAQISDKSFGLPTRAEFETAEKHGMREVVPNLDPMLSPLLAFWAAERRVEFPYGTYYFMWDNGQIGYGLAYNGFYDEVRVRCVAR